VISVLTPSRGRASSLRDSASGIIDHASDREAVEVLVALDPDDPEEDLAPYLTQGVPQVRYWTAPERHGYMQLHRYYNALAAMAKGEWLMIWNDDARMLTRGWDEVVHAQPPGVLWPTANHAPGGNFFPLWPKAWSDAWGHVALCANIDVWVQEVGTRVQRQWKIPVEVLHDRFDVTGNNDDATYREGRAAMGLYSNHPDYGSAANREARIRDAITVRRLMEASPAGR
jgi:hypothetical protein